jgi:very-short-patch-repair endonuclease
MIAREQRAALVTAIRKKFSDAKIECSDLPWLRVPKIACMDGPLKTIFAALHRHRGHTAFATEGRKLVCDIVIPSQRLIVEYDERQHFSMPRAIALRLYPKHTLICFDTAEWIAHCDAIAATDNDPPYRDEQRAFYDSARDILAGANGYRVVRLKHGAFDWQTSDADAEILRRVFVSQNTPSQLTFPRFTTVCIKGQSARLYRTHTRRLALLASLVREINERWGKLDAVVFPGGFLGLDRAIGQLNYADRVKALTSACFVKPITSAVRTLDRSHDALLVVGVDGPTYPNGDRGDQLCVAADKTGIVGIGRKVFPTRKESEALLCYDADFGDPHRVIQLASGRKAVLCACYDMFGVAERGDVTGTRAQIIRWIGNYSDQVERGTGCFHEKLKTNLAAFENLLTKENVTVGIAAIHSFSAIPRASGSDTVLRPALLH